MTRNLLISSLFCTALIGCGDKGGEDSNTTKTSVSGASAEDSASASETGGGETTEGVDPTKTTADPTSASSPTSDPTGATDDPTGGDGTTMGNFIVTPDGGTMGTIECDVFKQDCEEGEKCAAWAEGGGSSWNATKCVKVTGTNVPGSECMTEGGGVSGMDNCEAGSMCWDVDENNKGICVALCKGDAKAPICESGFSCAIANEGVLNLCLPGCDPLLQDCPGDDLCIPNGDAFLCVLDASGEMGKANDPCEFANSCDKGLVCLNTASASSACMQGSMGCCQPFCEFMEGQDGDCQNADQKCVQWFDPMMPIPPGLENVGVCAIPA